MQLEIATHTTLTPIHAPLTSGGKTQRKLRELNASLALVSRLLQFGKETENEILIIFILSEPHEDVMNMKIFPFVHVCQRSPIFWLVPSMMNFSWLLHNMKLSTHISKVEGWGKRHQTLENPNNQMLPVKSTRFHLRSSHLQKRKQESWIVAFENGTKDHMVAFSIIELIIYRANWGRSPLSNNGWRSDLQWKRRRLQLSFQRRLAKRWTESLQWMEILDWRILYWEWNKTSSYSFSLRRNPLSKFQHKAQETRRWKVFGKFLFEKLLSQYHSNV